MNKELKLMHKTLKKYSDTMQEILFHAIEKAEEIKKQHGGNAAYGFLKSYIHSHYGITED